MRNFISGHLLPIIITALLLNLSIPALASSIEALAETERAALRMGYPASAFSKAVQEEIRGALEVWGSKLAERGTETISTRGVIISRTLINLNATKPCINPCSSTSSVPFSTPISARSAISVEERAVLDLSYFTLEVAFLMIFVSSLEIGLMKKLTQYSGNAIIFEK